MKKFKISLGKKGDLEITSRQIIFLVLSIIILAIIISIVVVKLSQGASAIETLAEKDSLISFE